MNNWVVAKVIEVIHWTDNLFTIKLEAPVSPFIAGQFTKIALKIDNKYRQRAYSYVNAPSNRILEFYLVTVPEGKLSPYLFDLKKGNNLLIAKEATGFFVLSEIPQCNILWMLATGTAIGPYLSILQEKKDLDRFQYIVLVHAVRYAHDLCYLSLMEQLKHLYNGKLKIETIISRENFNGSLCGRIPHLIKNGELEKRVNLQIDAMNSHIMLCGNPNMVRETIKVLQDTRKMHKHLRRGSSMGHITTEHYW
ncbi:MAG: ferredoxin--NADP(+) reductase [Candidatus Dasytiphilus stammeri]